MDYVLVMSVNPGFGGQSFIPNCIDKIKTLRRMIADKDLATLIEIDGGVSTKTIGEIATAGADVFVAGSSIFGSPDYRAAIQSLRRQMSA